MPEATSAQITVHKLDARGDELWRYTGSLLELDGSKVVLEASFDRQDIHVEGLELRKGDRFIEHFYLDRWYNVFEVYQGMTGVHKGWYCNITRPAWLEGQELFAEDLALDLVVFPGGKYVVVDQDEFEDLDLPSEDRKSARRALRELIESAQAADGPFILKEYSP